MKHRWLLLAMMVCACSCALRKPPETGGQGTEGNQDITPNSTPARDTLASHYGCVDAGEWTKCEGYTDVDSCFAAGCNGSNGRCLPQDGSCAQHVTEEDCSADTACAYFQATEAECVNKCDLASSQEECDLSPPCSWLGYFGCLSPDAEKCALLDTSDACTADPECSVAYSECWGADTCDGLYTKAECESSERDCTWWDTWGCGPTVCWDLYERTECEANDSCGWYEGGDYCDEKENATCSALGTDACKTTTGCAMWARCMTAGGDCGDRSLDVCADVSHCVLPGWCTSACYPMQSESSCGAVEGTTCGWQEVVYRTEAQFRCTTACHLTNL